MSASEEKLFDEGELPDTPPPTAEAENAVSPWDIVFSNLPPQTEQNIVDTLPCTASEDRIFDIPTDSEDSKFKPHSRMVLFRSPAFCKSNVNPQEGNYYFDNSSSARKRRVSPNWEVNNSEYIKKYCLDEPTSSAKKIGSRRRHKLRTKSKKLDDLVSDDELPDESSLSTAKKPPSSQYQNPEANNLVQIPRMSSNFQKDPAYSLSDVNDIPFNEPLDLSLYVSDPDEQYNRRRRISSECREPIHHVSSSNQPNSIESLSVEINKSRCRKLKHSKVHSTVRRKSKSRSKKQSREVTSTVWPKNIDFINDISELDKPAKRKSKSRKNGDKVPPKKRKYIETFSDVSNCEYDELSNCLCSTSPRRKRKSKSELFCDESDCDDESSTPPLSQKSKARKEDSKAPSSLTENVHGEWEAQRGKWKTGKLLLKLKRKAGDKHQELVIRNTAKTPLISRLLPSSDNESENLPESSLSDSRLEHKAEMMTNSMEALNQEVNQRKSSNQMEINPLKSVITESVNVSNITEKISAVDHNMKRIENSFEPTTSGADLTHQLPSKESDEGALVIDWSSPGPNFETPIPVLCTAESVSPYTADTMETENATRFYKKFLASKPVKKGFETIACVSADRKQQLPFHCGSNISCKGSFVIVETSLSPNIETSITVSSPAELVTHDDSVQILNPVNLLNSEFPSTAAHPNTSKSLTFGSPKTLGLLTSDCPKTAASMTFECLKASSSLNSDCLKTSASLTSDCQKTAASLTSECLKISASLTSESLKTSTSLTSDCQMTAASFTSECMKTSDSMSSYCQKSPASLTSECLKTSSTLTSDCQKTPASLSSELPKIDVSLPSECPKTSHSLTSERPMTAELLASERPKVAIASQMNRPSCSDFVWHKPLIIHSFIPDPEQTAIETRTKPFSLPSTGVTRQDRGTPDTIYSSPPCSPTMSCCRSILWCQICESYWSITQSLFGLSIEENLSTPPAACTPPPLPYYMVATPRVPELSSLNILQKEKYIPVITLDSDSSDDPLPLSVDRPHKPNVVMANSSEVNVLDLEFKGNVVKPQMIEIVRRISPIGFEDRRSCLESFNHSTSEVCLRSNYSPANAPPVSLIESVSDSDAIVLTPSPEMPNNAVSDTITNCPTLSEASSFVEPTNVLPTEGISDDTNDSASEGRSTPKATHFTLSTIDDTSAEIDLVKTEERSDDTFAKIDLVKTEETSNNNCGEIGLVTTEEISDDTSAEIDLVKMEETSDPKPASESTVLTAKPLDLSLNISNEIHPTTATYPTNHDSVEILLAKLEGTTDPTSTSKHPELSLTTTSSKLSFNLSVASHATSAECTAGSSIELLLADLEDTPNPSPSDGHQLSSTAKPSELSLNPSKVLHPPAVNCTADSSVELLAKVGETLDPIASQKIKNETERNMLTSSKSSANEGSSGKQGPASLQIAIPLQICSKYFPPQLRLVDILLAIRWESKLRYKPGSLQPFLKLERLSTNHVDTIQKEAKLNLKPGSLQSSVKHNLLNSGHVDTIQMEVKSNLKPGSVQSFVKTKGLNVTHVDLQSKTSVQHLKRKSDIDDGDPPRKIPKLPLLKDVNQNYSKASHKGDAPSMPWSPATPSLSKYKIPKKIQTVLNLPVETPARDGSLKQPVPFETKPAPALKCPVPKSVTSSPEGSSTLLVKFASTSLAKIPTSANGNTGTKPIPAVEKPVVTISETNPSRVVVLKSLATTESSQEQPTAVPVKKAISPPSVKNSTSAPKGSLTQPVVTKPAPALKNPVPRPGTTCPNESSTLTAKSTTTLLATAAKIPLTFEKPVVTISEANPSRVVVLKSLATAVNSQEQTTVAPVNPVKKPISPPSVNNPTIAQDGSLKQPASTPVVTKPAPALKCPVPKPVTTSPEGSSTLTATTSLAKIPATIEKPVVTISDANPSRVVVLKPLATTGNSQGQPTAAPVNPVKKPISPPSLKNSLSAQKSSVTPSEYSHDDSGDMDVVPLMMTIGSDNLRTVAAGPAVKPFHSPRTVTGGQFRFFDNQPIDFANDDPVPNTWGPPQSGYNFISTDDAENADNFDPRWDAFRRVSDNIELYQMIRGRWNNLMVPDPAENLTLIHRGKMERPTNRPIHHPYGHRRTHSCTARLENIIVNKSRWRDSEIARLSAAQADFLHLQKYSHPNCNEDPERLILNLERKKWQVAQEAEDEIRKLNTYCQDMRSFYNFYQQIDPENNDGLITPAQGLLLDDTERTLEAYRHFYNEK